MKTALLFIFLFSFAWCQAQTSKVGINTNTPTGDLQVVSVQTNATIDQQQTVITYSAGSTDQWQSFTAGITGFLKQVDLAVGSPLSNSSSPGTIQIYNGTGTSGTLLSSTPVTYQYIISGFQSFPLATWVPVVAGNVYTIRFSAPSMNVGWVYFSLNNPYPGGQAGDNATRDYCFKTYVATQTNNVTTLTVAEGNVGIGTTTPTQKLDVNGTVNATSFSGSRATLATTSTTASPTLTLSDNATSGYSRLQFSNAGSSKYWHTAAHADAATDASSVYNIFYWNGSTGNNILSIKGNGDATLAGTLATNSDARLKTGIRPIGHAIQSLMLLSGYHYYWKEKSRDTTEQTGVLAQEVQKVFPELVSKDASGTLSVNYIGLIPHLLEATKAQQGKIEKMQKQNRHLQNRIEALEKLLLVK